MGTGTDPRDRHGLGDYVRKRILPLRPPLEPVPFRGCINGSPEALPFVEDMETSLRDEPGAVWSITGPSGCGKTLIARWVAARWGERFLEDPEKTPVVLWVDAEKLRSASAGSQGASTPVDFAGAAGLPEDRTEALLELWTHPFLLVVDRDDKLVSHLANFRLSKNHPPGLRVLHLALTQSLGGTSVELVPWDAETALLAAHRLAGAGGVEQLEALRGSPAAALSSYPLFMSWLLERRKGATGVLAPAEAVLEFLHAIQTAYRDGPPGFVDWCERLSRGYTSLAARKLHLTSAPGSESSWGTVFHAFVVAELLRHGRLDGALRPRHLDVAEISLLEEIPLAPEAMRTLERNPTQDAVLLENLINLRWRLLRTPLSKDLLRIAPLSGLQLAGHSFGGLYDARLEFCDLSGIYVYPPEVFRSNLKRCSLRQSSLAGVHFVHCTLCSCSLELADLSGSTFQGCHLEDLSLAEAVTSKASFKDSTFRKVTFGSSTEAEAPRFLGCFFGSCDMAALVHGGIFLRNCRLRGARFAGLAPKRFECEATVFSHSDFAGFVAPGAALRQAQLKDCILADVDLRNADLRESRFSGVDFQPGPASRAGLTEESSRSSPLYGSKSGFYAQEIVDGVYSDPELTRTADLRGADLRGATIELTDLFRVDLRGAKLDPSLLAAARSMRAFVD